MNWIDKLTKDGGGAGTADLWARVVRKSFLEKAGLKPGLGCNLSPGLPHHDHFGGPFGPTPELESQLQFLSLLILKIIYLAAPGFSGCTQTLSCGTRDLVPWPGIEPRPPALKAPSLSPRTTREVSLQFYFSLCGCSICNHFPPPTPRPCVLWRQNRLGFPHFFIIWASTLLFFVLV